MDAIKRLLTRGVDRIYPGKDDLEGILRSGKKIRLYQGFDPTGTKLHIGHAVAIRKLREFQVLGHEVIFLIGDGTGQAGDPSGKKSAREKFFTREELRANARDYVAQAGKIIRFDGPNPVKILYNGDWLNPLTLVDVLSIAQHFSVQQLIERDMYQDRMKRGESINLREFLYPLLQGYDSVAMNVDLELGGTDQTFNMLCGRTLVGAMLKKEKFVMTVPLLTDAKGTKIGKTEGNVIGLTDPPNELYGKIMALGDDAIVPCFTLLTDKPETEIAAMQNAIERGDNPMRYKKMLASDLTEQFNSKSEAVSAQENFEQMFQKKQPTAVNLATVTLKSGATVLEALTQAPFHASSSEVRRLVTAGSIDVNNVTITAQNLKDKVHDGDIIKKGKHTSVTVRTRT